MTADRAATERLVEAALAEHVRTNRGGGGSGCRCGWRGVNAGHAAHVAHALLAGPVDEALAAAKREALEDAADAAERMGGAEWRPELVLSWLRDRATGVQP